MVWMPFCCIVVRNWFGRESRVEGGGMGVLG